MATRSTNRREAQQRTESRLLDAAERVFSKRGYRAASLAEVAREAGHTTGAIYSNFDGKHGLFLAVAARQAAARLSDVAALDARIDRPAELENALRAAFAAFLEQNPKWAVLFYEFWSEAGADPELRAEFRAIRGVARDALAAPLRQAEAAGRLRAGHSPEAIAAVVLALATGIAFEHALDPDAVEVDAAAFAITAVVSAAVKPRDGDGA